jgi:hypothetical protein
MHRRHRPSCFGGGQRGTLGIGSLQSRVLLPHGLFAVDSDQAMQLKMHGGPRPSGVDAVIQRVKLITLALLGMVPGLDVGHNLLDRAHFLLLLPLPNLSCAWFWRRWRLGKVERDLHVEIQLRAPRP